MARNTRKHAPNEVRDRRPSDPEWRADALRQSPHRRLADEMPSPAAASPHQAEEVCRRISRTVLRDFAPALLLLSAEDRRRLRALTAWTATLLDFVRQGGLAGERLAGLNRWEFELDRALAGNPSPQPAFLELAREASRAPWDARDFDRLASVAREQMTAPEPTTPAQAAAASRRLAVALVGCFVAEPATPLLDLAEGLVRVRQLQDLGEALRRGLAVPVTAGMPWRREPAPPPGELAQAVHRECSRARALLMGGARGVHEFPTELRAAALWMVYAGLALITDVEDRPERAATQPPRLGLGRRIALLLRARWTARTLRWRPR